MGGKRKENCQAWTGEEFGQIEKSKVLNCTLETFSESWRGGIEKSYLSF